MLKVYVKPGCPWCVDVVVHLEHQGYQFEAIDVRRDPAAFDEMRRLTGQTLAPSITYGDLVLADCGVPELREFLNQHDIQP